MIMIIISHIHSWGYFSMRFTLIITILLLSLTVFSSCSGSNPASLSIDGNNTVGLYNSIPVGVTDRFPDGSPASGMGALGLFQLSVDPINAAAELTSLRQTALTDVLEVVDITNFLQLSPCTDCAKIGAVSLDADGNLVVSIGIRHPFESGNPLLPITGKNRADLHVFNIEGILVSNLPGVEFTDTSETIAEFSLVNADGYTGYLDEVLDGIYPTDATIHPYILYFDDYTAGNFDAVNPMGFESVTDPPPTGNLVMAMGCDYDYKDYVLSLGNDYVDFFFVVGCTYAISTETYSMRFNPEYRVPQHNKKAASELWVEIVSNNLEEDDTLSTAEIEINVVDISQDVPVGNARNEMLADSSVDEITVEIPGVMIDTLVIDGGSAISGTGHSPSEPLVYSGTVMNTANAVVGTYSGLVKVTDTYQPGLNETPALNGMDGIKRVPPTDNPVYSAFEITEFATYQVFSILVDITNDAVYVDDSNTSGTEDGSREHPYNTIQEGVDNCSAGWEVRVDDSGVPYVETVNMLDNVHVRGVNWDTSDGGARTTIDPPDDVDDACCFIGDGVGNFTIETFNCYPGGPVDGSSMNYFIRCDNGHDVTVRDCLFTGASDLSIAPCFFENTTNITVEYCRFDDLDRIVDEYGMFLVYPVYILDCDTCTVRNCSFSDFRETEDEGDKIIDTIHVENTPNPTIHNNVIFSIVPLAGVGYMGAVLLEGIHVENCANPVVFNNTVSMLDSSHAFMINQCFGYMILYSADGTFYNNIATHLYSSGWAPDGSPLARGIQSTEQPLTCDYTCTFDIKIPSGEGAHYFQLAAPGAGCIDVAPGYIDPASENFDIMYGGAAQMGHPDYVDWDDSGTPSGDPGNTDPETRSRMGCHGGPDGEVVGLLT